MIDHNLPQFGLKETYEGEQVQPSEKGNLHIPCNLRQFIIQANRAYSDESLELAEDNQGLNYKYHEGDIAHEVPYFYVKLVMQPDSSIKDFVDTKGDDFFKFLLETVGNSNVRYVRGRRPAFVGEFYNETDPQYGEVMISHLLIGTSVFYNDYRVTTNFPASHNELELVVGEIYQAILNREPSFKVELEFKLIENDCFADS